LEAANVKGGQALTLVETRLPASRSRSTPGDQRKNENSGLPIYTALAAARKKAAQRCRPDTSDRAALSERGTV